VVFKFLSTVKCFFRCRIEVQIYEYATESRQGGAWNRLQEHETKDLLWMVVLRSVFEYFVYTVLTDKTQIEKLYEAIICLTHT
jgi:hypothetical protein